MIGYFPDFYPDELVYSLLSRYHAENGYLGYISTAEDLFVNPWNLPDIDFLNLLSDDALMHMMRNHTLKEILLNHTMFPYYGRFLDSDRRKKAFSSLKSMNGNYRNLLSVQKNKTKKVRKIKYCPACKECDLKRYGQTYWHRIHQMTEINICPIHGCYLYESSVENSSKKNPVLEIADDHAVNTEIIACENELVKDVARFTAQVMQMEFDFNNQAKIGDFLHSRLVGTKYTSSRGQQRNITLLFADYFEKMKSIPWNTLDEVWKMSKVFANSRVRTLEICLIAYYLEIPANELAKMELPKEKPQDVFDNRVRELRQKGMSYPEISKELNTPLDTVKPIGEGLYGAYNKGRGINRGGMKSIDWNRRDIENLPKVKQAISEMYRANKRITPTHIQRLLDLPAKCFEKMPLCRNAIKKYQETTEEWFARKTVCAAKQVLERGDLLTYTSISRITNLKRTDYRRCIDCLSLYADEELVKQIRDVLE